MPKLSTDTNLLQRSLADSVNVERERRLAAGAVVTLSDGTGPIHVTGREKDLTIMVGLTTEAEIRIQSQDETPLGYRDENNVLFQLSPSQFIELFRRSQGWATKVYVASWQIKEMPAETTDPTDNSLWPNPTVNG